MMSLTLLMTLENSELTVGLSSGKGMRVSVAGLSVTGGRGVLHQVEFLPNKRPI